MTKCPDPLTLEAYVDGELPGDAPGLEAHFADCSHCRKEVEQLQRLNYFLRRAETSIVAPQSLTARMHAVSQSTKRSFIPTRRSALLGGLAAIAVGAVIVPLVHRERPFVLAPAIFGDFETGLEVGRPLDYYTSDFVSVQHWYRSKADLTAPDLTKIAGVTLNGGRLCWLLERRFLALDFKYKGDQYMLYVGSSGNLRMTEHSALPEASRANVSKITQGRFAAGVWQSDEAAYAVVGVPSQSELLPLAEAIRNRLTRHAT